MGTSGIGLVIEYLKLGIFICVLWLFRKLEAGSSCNMADIQLSLTIEKVVCNSLGLLSYPPSDFPKEMKVSIDVDAFKK